MESFVIWRVFKTNTPEELLAGKSRQYNGAARRWCFSPGAKSRFDWARHDHSYRPRLAIRFGRIPEIVVYQWVSAIDERQRKLLWQCASREFLFALQSRTGRRRRFESVEQARSEIFSYIEGYYNRIPRHSSLGYLSPLDFEKQLKIKIQRSKESFVSCFSWPSHTAVQFGISSDKLVVGDYEGDGKSDQAVYRLGIWYILGSIRGFYAFQFGIASDVPVAVDYDGDGRTDIAVFRDGVWYWLQSSNNQFRAVQFGSANDKPVPAAFVL